ncbi:hypothetical protein MS3_00003984 [Schistosoma haematobium]|uniref:Uncharacterized protein n=1 Tax=Schistosoma haematobium TaxID=6185 RepID=A0A922LR99_SCHHA|nr:hypothetical protein MS3_00003984 [Schistosoma haematobium]KAH9591856.1 hypothetical protein MS3_00003984 [Schistosoma haematobium]CAH8673802.1 unnamed protein product [Schistosoma haematobium]CAH8677777.1 unnamed protein product [Schistosoma haematobium]
MSSQKGNTQRTRPQKYKNTKAFKNNLHDTSKEVKRLNNLTFDFLCPRCTGVVQWRVKYKKYHQLANPRVCVKCNGKTVKQAYHTICTDCSSALKICSKCGKSDGSITFGATENQEDINQQFIDALKNVRERERRALLRLTQSNKKPIESGNINADEEFHLNSLNKLIVKELSDIKFDEDKYESDDYKYS